MGWADPLAGPNGGAERVFQLTAVVRRSTEKEGWEFFRTLTALD